ncbi:MAG: hypothetical protein CM15mP129_09000 [Chloroflexota bacterium]|nr:MAG: hypothetical protein CM15mP129_09000 [Chloroflexota bacterium]
MRQAGIIAAAGIYALENMVERLEEDHNNAKNWQMAYLIYRKSILIMSMLKPTF